MGVKLGAGEPKVEDSEEAGILKIQRDAECQLFH